MQMRQSKRLSDAHLKLFVAIIVQNEVAFTRLKGKLRVEHFADEVYQLVYRVLIDFHDANKELPSLVELRTEAEALLESESDALMDSSEEDLEEFFDYLTDPDIFSDLPPTHVKMTNFAVKVGRILLTQQQAVELRESLQEADPDKLPGILEQAQRQFTVLNALSAQKSSSKFFEPGWDKTNAYSIVTSGYGFFDKYMGGGTRVGEVYGLMAPFGTCKTTIGVMLWTRAALQCYEETVLNKAEGIKGKTGVSFFVSYEAPKLPELAQRALMCTARVHRNSLESMGTIGLDMLSNDKSKPKKYELSEFASMVGTPDFIPERKRVENIIPILNKHAICLDFSGSDKDNPEAGSGGVSEIINRIEFELQMLGPNHYVKNVIIDYLGILVDRDTNIVRGRRDADDHKTYQMAVQRISKELTKKFSCHAWVLHQLSGEANAVQSVTKKLHHTDAKGSKSFAENLDFCFVIGNLTVESLGQLSCTKHRRHKKMLPSIIKVDGEFNRVMAPDNYVVDIDGNIVTKNMAQAGGTVGFVGPGELQAEDQTSSSSGGQGDNNDDEADGYKDNGA